MVLLNLNNLSDTFISDVLSIIVLLQTDTYSQIFFESSNYLIDISILIGLST